jgi:hypothetical protein
MTGAGDNPVGVRPLAAMRLGGAPPACGGQSDVQERRI